MTIRKLQALAVAACLFAAPASWAAISYSQDFEGLDQTSSSALSDDGWLVGANVFAPDGTTFLYNYFTFPAPNGGPGFSGIDIGQGGADQGNQQLVVYNDYNNGDHTNGTGNRIEANVFQEFMLTPGDAGTYTFTFDSKAGNIAGASTAQAFIKTLDPANGFAVTGIDSVATGLDPNWLGFSLSLTVDASQAGQVFQFGFLNVASNEEGSGVFYDNINVIPVPAAVWLFGSALGLLGFVRRRMS